MFAIISPIEARRDCKKSILVFSSFFLISAFTKFSRFWFKFTSLAVCSATLFSRFSFKFNSSFFVFSSSLFRFITSVTSYLIARNSSICPLKFKIGIMVVFR